MSSPFAPGTLLADKYLVERELAEGGLGIIVVATQVELGRPVAIKYLKPSVAENPVVVERFKREAKLASSIRSDHVVRIHDVGSDPVGGPFMVMEYLEGEDLGDRVDRGPLPVREAIDYIVQACDALAEAHALGIVHRDLKPENLFLARRSGAPPIVKVLDFGISKVTESANPKAVRGLTGAGTLVGTPVYMSPEQLIGDPVDTRSDIWALGVVLFELVSGALPFEGESVPQIGAAILTSPATPLRAKLPTASAELEATIARCLDKNPAARYRNVAELVEELVAFDAPASESRIGRIRHVVSTGGQSIRPPRQLASAASPDATPMAVLAPSQPPLPMRQINFSSIAAGVLLVAVIVLGLLLLRAERPAVNAAPPPPASMTLPPPRR